MWSRLTELAEKGLAEVAASADGAPQEDELWARFTAIVAPPGDERRELSGAEREQERELELETAKAEEDEQEQYICELERALLQRKRANEALEAKVRDLEAAQDAQTEAQLKRQLQAAEMELARQKEEHERLLLKQRAEQQQQHAIDQGSLTAKVGALEGRLASLQTRCQAVQNRLLDAERVRSSSAASLQPTDRSTALSDTSEDEVESKIFPTLVQITLLLQNALATNHQSEMPTSEQAMAEQIAALTKIAKESLQSTASRNLTLESTIGSFCSHHGHPVDFSNDNSWATSLQSTLGALSHQLAKADSDSAALERARAQLENSETENGDQLKKILQLQAQLNSLQAYKQRSDRSMLAIASKESQLVEGIEAKDKEISRLEAQIGKMKSSLEVLGQELELAHSDVDELVARSRGQQQEVSALQERVATLQSANDQLEEECRDARSRAAEYEQGYINLLSELEVLKQQSQAEKAELLATTEAHAESTDSQAMYELESRLAAAEADKEVAEQDADRLQKELDTLEGVLHDFQLASKSQKERVATLETALEETQQAQKMTKSAGIEQDDDFERVMAVLAKKTQECDQLREALENAASQQYSTEKDVLDKRLAAQLVVSYIDSDKKGDVLQLIARMMGFTEEQKRRVGIGYPMEGHGGGGLFSSIIGLVAPPESTGGAAAPAAIEGKSFSEAWANFLVDEAGKK